MSNDEDEFGFSDSTAVDVGAQDYRSPVAAGLDAVPPPLPPGAVSEASSGTERQDNLPDWEDDDGGKTAAFDISAIGDLDLGEDLVFGDFDDQTPADPNRTMAMDVSKTPEPPKPDDSGYDDSDQPERLDLIAEDERTQLATPAFTFDEDVVVESEPPEFQLEEKHGFPVEEELAPLVSVESDEATAAEQPVFIDSRVDVEPNSLPQSSDESPKEEPIAFSPYGPAGGEATRVQVPPEAQDVDSTMMFDASELLQPRTAGPQGVITILEGNDAGKEYFLRGEATIVGRGLDCDLVLNDPSVSRRHFRLERAGDTYTMIDLGSGNGTKVNGTRVTEMVLGQSAHISIGTSVLQFGFVGSDARAPVEKLVDVKGTTPALRVGLAALILIVASGAGWFLGEDQGWWSTDNAKPEILITAPEKVAEPPVSETVLLTDKVREFLSKKQLSEAAGMIDALESEGGDAQLVTNLRARVVAAQSHRSLIAAQKQRLMTGDAEEVMTSLEVIPTTSPFYTDADALRDKAQQILVEGWKESAYDYGDRGKRDEAKAVLMRVLSLNPDDGEAKTLLAALDKAPALKKTEASVVPQPEKRPPALQAQSEASDKPVVAAAPDDKAQQAAKLAKTEDRVAGATASPGTKPLEEKSSAAVKSVPVKKVGSESKQSPMSSKESTGAPPSRVAAAATSKTPKAKAKRKVAKATKLKPSKRTSTSPRAKAVSKPTTRGLRSGYRLYSSRKFSAAAAEFERASDDSRLSNKDRSKAASLAAKVRRFGSLYTEGMAAAKAFQPSVAIPKLKKASALDKAISGTYGGEIRRRLAKMFAFKAAGAYSSSNYRQAAKMASTALKYNRGEASARLIREKVEGKVGAMMVSAKSAKASGNLRSAERQLTTILAILPESDSRAKAARRMLNEIIASRADEDDD
jgi:tetratricopeptide (TPR) repeat protein